MKTLLALLACSLSLCAQAQFDDGSTLLAWQRSQASASGPNIWYDIQDCTSNPNNDIGASPDREIWATVTVAQAGTATKLRLRIIVANGSGAVTKMALYNNSGVKIADGGSQTITTTGITEFSLVTPVVVSATTYQIYAVCGDPSNTQTIGVQNTLGTLNFKGTSGAYAAAPPANLATGQSTLSWNVCFGVFVQ